MKNENFKESIAYQLRAGLQMRQFGLDQGIYNHETRQIFMLNPMAALIFNYLTAGKPADEIVENIIIACGKNAEKPSSIKKDLLKIIDEFFKQELLESAENSSYVLESPLIITENEMTSLSIPYLRPSLNVYSIEELRKKYSKGNEPNLPGSERASFSDTWNPTNQSIVVSFLDTWSPIKGGVNISNPLKPIKDKFQIIEKGKKISPRKKQ